MDDVDTHGVDAGKVARGAKWMVIRSPGATLATGKSRISTDLVEEDENRHRMIVRGSRFPRERAGVLERHAHAARDPRRGDRNRMSAYRTPCAV
jgi:hypothetical protein